MRIVTGVIELSSNICDDTINSFCISTSVSLLPDFRRLCCVRRSIYSDILTRPHGTWSPECRAAVPGNCRCDSGSVGSGHRDASHHDCSWAACPAETFVRCGAPVLRTAAAGRREPPRAAATAGSVSLQRSVSVPRPGFGGVFVQLSNRVSPLGHSVIRSESKHTRKNCVMAFHCDYLHTCRQRLVCVCFVFFYVCVFVCARWKCWSMSITFKWNCDDRAISIIECQRWRRRLLHFRTQ